MLGRQKKPKLIVSGSIVRDYITTYPQKIAEHFPKNDKSFSISLVVDSAVSSRGGTGANIAYALAIFGEKPILLGAVGREDVEYIDSLSQLGILTQAIHFSNLLTAQFFVVTDGVQSQLAVFNPGAMEDSESLSFAPFADQNVLAVISPHLPAAMHRQIQECVNLHIPYCFDFGQQVHDASVEMLALGVKDALMIIANEQEYEVLEKRTGIPRQQLIAKRPYVITTFGADGAEIAGTELPEPLHIPIAKVEHVVDPTAAGDAWRAGFLWAFIRNLPLEVAGRCGAVSAAFCLEEFGGQNHHFSLQEFLNRYEENFGESAVLRQEIAAQK